MATLESTGVGSSVSWLYRYVSLESEQNGIRTGRSIMSSIGCGGAGADGVDSASKVGGLGGGDACTIAAKVTAYNMPK